jgi:hypothetical protein
VCVSKKTISKCLLFVWHRDDIVVCRKSIIRISNSLANDIPFQFTRSRLQAMPPQPRAKASTMMIGGQFDPFPQGVKVHVLTISRTSPRTINDGSCQRATCRAGIELLAKQGFFPGGYLLIETKTAIEHSGYRTEQSHALFEVLMYITRNPGATFLVVASNVDRFGRDHESIEIFRGSVKKLAPTCEFLSICHLGLTIEQIQGMCGVHQIDRVNVNQHAKDETEALKSSPKERQFVSNVEEQVCNLTANDLGVYNDHASQALSFGMDTVHNLEEEVKSIIGKKLPHIETMQLLLELKKSSGRDDVESKERHTIHYFRQSNGKPVKMTADGLLPLDQVMYVIAATKELGDTPQPDMILFDKWKNRDQTPKGLITMIALVADGQVDRIVVKSHERVPSAHMSVLSELCNKRKTEIVVVKQYGKSLVDMADSKRSATSYIRKPQ